MQICAEKKIPVQIDLNCGFFSPHKDLNPVLQITIKIQKAEMPLYHIIHFCEKQCISHILQYVIFQIRLYLQSKSVNLLISQTVSCRKKVKTSVVFVSPNCLAPTTTHPPPSSPRFSGLATPMLEHAMIEMLVKCHCNAVQCNIDDPFNEKCKC